MILSRAKNFNCFGGSKYFLEIVRVIQSWIHTNQTRTNLLPAICEMRHFGGSLSAVGLRADFENSNYQEPKQGGSLDRLVGEEI